MNSACWPLAVCSATHGAILFVEAPGPGTPPCMLMARKEPIAPEAMMAAATKNNEQNRRRHGNGINVQFEFVVIEFPVRIGLVAVNGRPERPFTPKPRRMPTFFAPTKEHRTADMQ